jgi:hypothetical protein
MSDVEIPPCIEYFIRTNPISYLNIIASYFKTYGGLEKLYEMGVDARVIRAVKEFIPDAPNFMCELVQAAHSNACDKSKCTLLAKIDPVEFLVNRITKAKYNVATKDLFLWFKDVSQPLVINVSMVMSGKRDAVAEIATYTLENFGKMLVLGKVKDAQTGEKRDLLIEFIEKIFPTAEKVNVDDPTDFYEAVLKAVEGNQVVPKELATAATTAFVYEDEDGKKYLAIKSRNFMNILRNIVGGSRRQLKSLLTSMGVEKHRLRLRGERDYYYLIPEKIVVEATGQTLDEIVNEVLSPSEFEKELDEELMRMIHGGDEEEQEGGGNE